MHLPSPLTSLALAALLLAVHGCRQTQSTADAGLVRAAQIEAAQDENARIGATNVVDLIEGRVPGLTVVRSSSGPRFRIRGTNSFELSGDALIVLDGVPIGTEGSALMALRPSEIEDIRVLRGTDAAAYGSRGSNGVVVVTTRR